MTFVLYTRGPAKIGSTVIGGITALNAGLGSQVKSDPTSGQIYAAVTALLGQKLTAGFTTEDLQAALGAIGTVSYDLASGNLVLYGSRIKASGQLDSSNHLSFTAALGVIYPKTLQCAHQQDATLQVEAQVLGPDDTTDPLAVSTAATLPTIASVGKWTLGAMTIAGITVTENVNVSVDFGLKVQGEGADSNIRDQLISVRQVTPKITLTSLSQGNLLSSLLGAQGSFSLAFRHRLHGGTFGTAVITLTGTCLGLQEKLFEAGQPNAQSGLEGHVLYDGTHVPITYTYNSGT
jgi:hypothetical protein